MPSDTNTVPEFHRTRHGDDDRRPELDGSGRVRLSCSGIHWFDRTTGVNVLLEEISIAPELWARAPRYVSIALTNACELECPFCYAPKTPARLEARQTLSWVEELDDAGALGVGFGGGEPLAHPKFAWLCRQTSERTGLAVSFTTHAHRITQQLAAELAGSVHFIRASMDGTGSTYEQLRGRSFNSFREKLKLIATIAPFGINVVVNDLTVTELDEMAEFATAVGASELLLLPEQPVGDRPGITNESSRRLAAWATTAMLPYRLTISRAGTPADIPLADPFPSEQPLDQHAHIDAEGNLRLHAYAPEGTPIGPSLIAAIDRLREASTP